MVDTAAGQEHGETAQGGLPADATFYTNDPSTLDSLDFEEYVKKGTTRMAFVQGPFRVSTLEGVLELPEDWTGYIALDAKGHPYPVEKVIADRTYERVS